MNLYSLQVYILGGLNTCLLLASSKSLDMYCAGVAGGKYQYSSHTVLQKYFMICRDVAKYFDCISRYRADKMAHQDLVVMPYETFFPKMDDLKRATYWLCLLDLFKLHKMFNYKNMTCELQINDAGCREKYESPSVMSQLQEALHASIVDETLVMELSCSIAAPLTVCIQDQFLNCSKDFSLFKQYELGRFGIHCLENQSLVSSYTHDKFCSSSSIHSGRLPIHSWLMAVVLPVVILAVCKIVKLRDFE